MFDDGNNIHSGLGDALARLRASMPDMARERADRLAGINARYIGTKRDDVLTGFVDLLVGNAAGAVSGEPGKRRALFVVGESGSGKSTAIRRLIETRPEFQPYQDGVGVTVNPMVSFDAPSPLTLRLLATVGVEAVGYPVYGRLQENEAWDLFKRQIMDRRVLFLHIDEMQHALKGNSTVKLQHLADTLKSLLQIPGWPLHIILSGVPELVSFLDHDQQLKNRSMVMEFTPETVASKDILKAILTRIVERHASMKLAADACDDEFVARLIHAAGGAFGTIIQIVRAAVEHVLYSTDKDGRPVSEVVASRSFGEVYAAFTGCAPNQNVFTSAKWMDIVPSNALRKVLEKRERDRKKGVPG